MNGGPQGDAADNFLGRMAGLSRRRLEQAQSGCTIAELQRRADAATAAPGLVLSTDGFDLIAEDVELGTRLEAALKPSIWVMKAAE